MTFPQTRLRRNRRTPAIRNVVRETQLSPCNFVMPLFVVSDPQARESIASMPGIFRLGIDHLIQEAKTAWELGIQAVALFPALPDSLKDKHATESLNPDGLVQTVIRRLKAEIPEMIVITDVAMDPYSSDGHDGLVIGSQIDNDQTLEILGRMAVSQAEAGADYVAPSDMMDGRIGHIRRALDEHGHTNVGIISYAAKYASNCYGPFRDALSSTPRFGDKKTYQMDPANAREALREVEQDVIEGADIILIKPAMLYLDIIYRTRQLVNTPIAAYNVSGEYAMIKAAGSLGWLDQKKVMLESLLAIKRAGADLIFTYFALEAAKALQD